MPQERYEALLLERAHARRRWENQPAQGVELDDLGHEEILRTVRLGIQAGRLPEGTGTDIGEILNRLKLRDKGRLLDAAVVLFAKDPLPDYPQCKLRLARFKGTDKSEFLDNRQVHGHAFRLLEEGMDFLLRHLPIAGRFEPGRVERIDEPLFPVAALREALVNALCHRDYAITGGAVDAAIYDDRLGIVNLCVRAGHPEPEFIEQAGAFGVRFVPSRYIAPHRVMHDLTERQRDLLHILARGDWLAFAEIRDHLPEAPSDRSIRNDLMHLRNLGLARLEGHGRGARWALVRGGEERGNE